MKRKSIFYADYDPRILIQSNGVVSPATLFYFRCFVFIVTLFFLITSWVQQGWIYWIFFTNWTFTVGFVAITVRAIAAR